MRVTIASLVGHTMAAGKDFLPSPSLPQQDLPPKRMSCAEHECPLLVAYVLSL